MKRFRTVFFPLLLLAIASQASAMEVSVERDATLPIAYVNLALRGGYVTDPVGQAGLTNFMSEMLLRGTKSRTREQIDLEVDQMGAKLDVEVRAESVIVRGAVLNSQLDRFLKLLTDILTQPSFPEQEIMKLKAEIKSGILEELDSDPALVSRKFDSFLFRGHPYGKPLLGTMKGIDGLNQNKLRAHYNNLVRDKLMLLVATGDVDEGKLKKWANSLAEARSGGTTIPRVQKPTNAGHRRLLIVDKPDRTQTQMMFGQIGLLMTDPSYFPLYIGNYAFGGGSFGSRLMQEIRVKRGWTYGAGSGFRFGLEPRKWNVRLFSATKDTPEALGYALKMVGDLKTGGLTAEEYDFAKASLINSSGFMYNTARKRVENKLLEKTLDLPDGFMSSYAAHMEKVTLAEVNDALKKFLKPEELAITVVATASQLKDPLVQAAGVRPGEVEVVPYTKEEQ